MVARAKCAGCKLYFSKEELQAVGLQRFCSTECAWESRDRQEKKAKIKAKAAKPPRKSRPRSYLDASLRTEVRERDGHVCRWCGRGTTLEVHHIHYRSEGGRDHASNLILLCQEHHQLAHSNKRVYQPLLLATLWIHYMEGRYRIVPEVMKRLLSQGYVDKRGLPLAS